MRDPKIENPVEAKTARSRRRLGALTAALGVDILAKAKRRGRMGQVQIVIQSGGNAS
jgi:hypothetical protein